MYVYVSKYRGHLSNMAYISAKSEIENNTLQQKQIFVYRLYIYLPTYLSTYLPFLLSVIGYKPDQFVL
jgi:hypothetical protein